MGDIGEEKGRGGLLDQMILEVLYNLNDSMILWFYTFIVFQYSVFHYTLIVSTIKIHFSNDLILLSWLKDFQQNYYTAYNLF